ncbi:MAG: efflux RND transporter periplasmic adaptor subunit [Polyangiaceae bacterium]
MSDSLSNDLASLRIDRTRAPRPNGGPLKTLLGVLVGLGVLGAAYVYGKPYLEAQLFKTQVDLTEISLVSPAQASVELTATGYIVAQSVSKVSAKVPGKVAKILVKQSDLVKAGDVLFIIDPMDQQATIASARSQAAAARARAVAARASQGETEVQLTRAKNLAAQGVGPQSSVDDLSARATSLKEQVNASDADARASAALVSQLEVNLKNFTVVAPIGGTVINRPPELGEFVGPQPAGVAVDMGGVQIANFDTQMVETDVPEQRLSLVKIGAPTEIVLDAYPDRRYRGKVHEITPKVDRAKATVLVKVAFVDEKTGVMPDMSARVSFLNGELDKEAIKAPPKTIVPSEAIADVAGAKVVYVLNEGKARLTPIDAGACIRLRLRAHARPRTGHARHQESPPGLSDGQAVKARTEE